MWTLGALWLASVVALGQGDVDAEIAARVARAEAAVTKAKKSILAVYGPKVTEGHFLPPDFYSEQARGHIVERLLRAVVLGDSFVIAVGGMSDVAGHGNLFEESYPLVCGQALKPVFEAAGVKFDVRNMAMGGVPSYPSSVCMADDFGSDVDLVVWDFRMVERDEHKGELYVRQAMMLPKAPFVMYKRKQGYLQRLHYAHGDAALHVIDEMPSYNHIHKLQSEGVTSDKFCEATCACPGQVRWHSGWKMQRFRGLHMAWNYLTLLADSLTVARELLGSKALPPPGDGRWTIAPRPGAALHKPISNLCKDDFCSRTFRCAMSWAPVQGRALASIIDPQLGLNGWKLQHPSKKVAEITRTGHAQCHYQDEKQSIVGNDKSHWVFFQLPGVVIPDDPQAAPPIVGFCGDFQSAAFADYALIVLNQEEIMDKLDMWLESKTLGISSACFATKHNVVDGENILGFRVTAPDHAMSITHVFWS